MSSLSEMWGFRNFDLCIIDHPLTFKEDERWDRPVRRGDGSTQCCVLTNSSPLGVGQAPVENSWGTYKTKNVAQKKLA